MLWTTLHSVIWSSCSDRISVPIIRSFTYENPKHKLSVLNSPGLCSPFLLSSERLCLCLWRLCHYPPTAAAGNLPGLEPNFCLSSVSVTSLPLPSSGTAHREGESLHNLVEAEMRSSFWLQSFPKAACTVQGHSQVQPLEDCSQQRPFPATDWGSQRSYRSSRVFPLCPSNTHKHSPHCLFPAQVWLQTRRREPAGMGSRQSSSCCLGELLVPSAGFPQISLLLLQLSLCTGSHPLCSRGPLTAVLWVNFLAPSQPRRSPKRKVPGKVLVVLLEPLHPWQGTGIAGSSLGGNCQLGMCSGQRRQRDSSWLVAPQAEVDFTDFLKIGKSEWQGLNAIYHSKESSCLK